MNNTMRPRTTVSMPANLTFRQSSLSEIIGSQVMKNGPTQGSNQKTPSECQNKDLSTFSFSNNKDPTTFSNRYKEICQSMHIQPLNMVRVLLSNVSLDITLDKIKLLDLIAILKTIQDDRSLHYISLKSKLTGYAVQEHIDTERKTKEIDRVLFTRYIINRIADCLRECVIYSHNLKALKLQGIPFGGSSTEILSQGLRKTETLQHLSLEQCKIGDEGCLLLCRALRGIPTILTLDLTSANVTTTGAGHIANLIKAQEITRLEQNWKQSLRYRTVNNEEMKGLRRVTLNDNPLIRDEGFKLIVDVLLDDFWIRALDVQNCGITDFGGALAMELIKTNSEIGVLDLRRNPHISNRYVTAIVKTLSENMTPEKLEYGWFGIQKNNKTTAEYAESSSSFYNYPWNCGPGIKKAKSLAVMDHSTKTSIMKVKEWSESRENSKGTSEPPMRAREIQKSVQEENKVDLKESPSNSSNDSSDFPSLSNDSSDSLEKTLLNNKNKTGGTKKTEDIELLFCSFINSPA